MLRSLLALLMPLLLVAMPVHALDTSAGVGLQDRALFQETVDYTLTNQSNGDFHGQNLANTSFAGAVGRGADFRDATCTARSSRRGPSLRRTSVAPTFRMP